MEILFFIALGTALVFVFLYSKERTKRIELEEEFTNSINKIVEDYEYSIETYKSVVQLYESKQNGKTNERRKPRNSSKQ